MAEALAEKDQVYEEWLQAALVEERRKNEERMHEIVAVSFLRIIAKRGDFN